MPRARFFQVRLAVSAALLLLLVSVVRGLWYPGAYYDVSAVGSKLAILALVVFVAGPVLSTFVYRPGKKGLAMDLGILAGLELAAVVAAATVLYLRQPYFTVFAVDRFEAVSRQEVVDFEAARAQYGSRPGHEPRLVFASLPEDPDRMQALIDETVFMGMADIDRRPEFWSPYVSGINRVRQAARPLADLAMTDDDRGAAIANWLNANGRAVDRFLYLPLRGKAGDATIVLDAASGFPVATLPIVPWRSP